ncbi:MAG: molecular chaperone [Alphaproteobacteria bacterium]
MQNTAMKLVLGALALGVLVSGLIAVSGSALANMTIMPIRVVIENRDRSAEVTVINTTNRTVTYQLAWGNRRARAEGGYEHLDAPLDPVFDPAQHLVFSPRQVTIAPGQSQRVRITVRRPADLPDGEYRAHLVFMSQTAARSSRRPTEGVEMNLSPRVGLSVPVFVRQGEYNAGAKIANPEFVNANHEGTQRALRVTLERIGTHSINGALEVHWTPPGQPERQIGRINNIVTFHELPSRIVTVTLNENYITSGVIRVAFVGVDRQRGMVFDEVRFPVGN